MGLIVSLLIAAGVASAAPAQQRLYAGGHWAAHRFGSICQAAARPLPPAANREKHARAAVAFRQGGGGGRIFVRLSRLPRTGTTAMLVIGDRPFLLVQRDAWAQSRDSEQAAAITAAMRGGRSMRVQARDVGGRRFTDYYLLKGAPTAIDSAAAACAGKMP